MYPASLLPRSLLALIAATAVHAAPSIHNDPFHHIAIHAPKLQKEPICCLRPLTPQEPVDSDLLLSFEDWKERQLAESQQASSSIPNASVSSTAVPTGSRSNESSSGETGAEPPPTTSSLDISTGSDPSPEPMSPHFQIPITDRFNYASLDCSARVHSTHRGAKSAANILSSKKDRYMLSPCANDPKFIVIELCDDIWIDTVQLANHEFFSGVFRDFTVSVAKTYAVEKTEWTVVGTYTARNVRSVQSFHPPNSLRDFYRFMRIDFHSHYGNEYYCPISLLRVYGLTHLEQWKWDMWEKESKEKLMATELELPLSSEDSPEVPNPAQMADTVSPAPAPTTTAKAALYSAEVPIEDAVEPDEPVFRHSTDIAMSESPLSSATEPSPDLATPPPPSPTPDTPHSLNSTLSISTISTPETPSSPKLVTPTISLAPAAPPAYLPSTGESIYRTIMNRLTALESNTTLYARYVNEQTTAMRDALRRMSEDVGRLEGINRAQAQEVRRTLSDLSRQRRRMEVEQRALAARVAALADDVTLEKRLGVAQLCLLLAVLVFLSVTRGSRGEYADPRTLPGHWASRLRARSLTPTRSPAFAPATPEKEKEANGVPFPTSVTTARPGKRPILGLALPPDGIARQRARTPSRRHQYVVHARGPSTPTSARPSLRRSDSHSSAGPSASMPMLVGPVPRSARMWARTAHLHEVRPKNHDRGMTVRVGRGESIGTIELNEAGEETAWVDTDEGSETDLSLAGRSKCH